MSEEKEQVYSLLKRAYELLNYCGYGDSWERGRDEELREDLDNFFELKENGK